MIKQKEKLWAKKKKKEKKKITSHLDWSCRLSDNVLVRSWSVFYNKLSARANKIQKKEEKKGGSVTWS